MSLSFRADLSGKIAVVTGANGVLCGMFAKTIVEAGTKVVVLDLNEEATGKVADEIMVTGGTVEAYKTNVLERVGLEETYAKTLVELGPYDILINGAGGNNIRVNTAKEYFEIGNVEVDIVSLFDSGQSSMEFVFSLNFIGTLLPTQIFAKDMAERKGYTVLNVPSMDAFTPPTKIPTYSGARAAVNNLTQWLAVHFSKMEARVNAMVLDFFVTKQNEKLLFNEDGTPAERAVKILATTPMERFGEAEESSGTLSYLLNNEASGFVTSAVIPVDGGFSAYSGV